MSRVVYNSTLWRHRQQHRGTGGRVTYGKFLKPKSWKAAVDEALRQALVNLESVDAPSREMTVVLGPAWPGMLLHEALGVDQPMLKIERANSRQDSDLVAFC